MEAWSLIIWVVLFGDVDFVSREERDDNKLDKYDKGFV